MATDNCSICSVSCMSASFPLVALVTFYQASGEGVFERIKMPEIGNSNLLRTYKGKYKLTGSGGVNKFPIMLSITNDVIFMQNLLSNSSGLVCTLPQECTPIGSHIYLPVYVQDNGLQYIDISTDGSVTSPILSKTHYLTGISFNISKNFYG